MSCHMTPECDVVAALRSQLAAVEKERDEARTRTERLERELRYARFERDEAKKRNADVGAWLLKDDVQMLAEMDRLKAERDAATARAEAAERALADRPAGLYASQFTAACNRADAAEFALADEKARAEAAATRAARLEGALGEIAAVDHSGRCKHGCEHDVARAALEDGHG